MEDFFNLKNGENKLLKNISTGLSCWQVSNNNNNVLNAVVHNFKKNELLFAANDKEQQQIQETAEWKQRADSVATKKTTATKEEATKVTKHTDLLLGVVQLGSISSGITGHNMAKGEKQTSTSSLPKTIVASVAPPPTCVARIEDEGGGGGASVVAKTGDDGILSVEMTDKLSHQNGAATPSYIQYNMSATASKTTTGAAVTTLSYMATLPSLNCDALDAYDNAAAAAAISPTDIAVAAAAVGLGGSVGSNRTSINNSTENLSYASDNYYPDDLILLDDDDVEAEEISLNSDDCVYAYRGDAADLELAALNNNLGRGGIGDMGSGIGTADDETDFLEMDFEPDPLSEGEYASYNADVEHADLYLMQRDFSQISGRHSANMSLQVTPTRRQLFSSPIDDLPPQEALQSQSQRLNKNFARISLHLDQIKSEDTDDICDSSETLNTRHAAGLNTGLGSLDYQTAHSLPNTLYTNFGRDSLSMSIEPFEQEKSPSKITGAKPKRLSTFSTSSSVSSKNSSKSRTSLRSAFASAQIPGQTSGSSFDERCASCTDFRSSNAQSHIENDCTPMLANVAAAVVAASSVVAANGPNCDIDLSTNDETCLDCLEKEFLASTIGKAIDLSGCAKCRKRCSSLSLYTHAEQARCRSGSPNYFLELRDDCIFNTSNMPTPHKRNENKWNVPILPNIQNNTSTEIVNVNEKDSNEHNNSCDLLNQRGACTKSDIKLGAELHKIMTPARAQLATRDINEVTLVQALDSMRVSYNPELITTFFKNQTNAQLNCSEKIFKNLKEFLLHAAKEHGNYIKYKKLIQMATESKVDVQFKKEIADSAHEEVVPIKVADIIRHWTREKDLMSLRALNKHFQEANILGKVANILRQYSTMKQTTSRRTIPEFIFIPQYYPRGTITLIRNC